MSRLTKGSICAILLFCMISVCLVAVNGWAANKCYVCEVDLSSFANTKYTITSRKGERFEACSFYCAALILKRNKAKKVMVIDYNTGVDISAKRATYVIGSAVNEAVHNKSWLAFDHKYSARTFILQNGGMSRRFKDALKAMSTRLDNKANIPVLPRSKRAPGCLKCHGE